MGQYDQVHRDSSGTRILFATCRADTIAVTIQTPPGDEAAPAQEHTTGELASVHLALSQLLQASKVGYDLCAAQKLCLAAPLGVDFGKARIGLATCPGGLISVPYKILVTKRRPWLELAKEILDVAQQQGTVCYKQLQWSVYRDVTSACIEHSLHGSRCLAGHLLTILWPQNRQQVTIEASRTMQRVSVAASQVNTDWNSTSGLAQLLNKPTSLSQFTNNLTGSSAAWAVPGNLAVTGTASTGALTAASVGLVWRNKFVTGHF